MEIILQSFGVETKNMSPRKQSQVSSRKASGKFPGNLAKTNWDMNPVKPTRKCKTGHVSFLWERLAYQNAWNGCYTFKWLTLNLNYIHGFNFL